MSYLKSPMLPLLLAVGVAAAMHLPRQDEDEETLHPIVTRSQQRKICAELCVSGLGGLPCGEDCVDLVPQDMPLQFEQENTTVQYGVYTRHSACDLLCDNNLGYPLCGCSYDRAKTTDYQRVCGHFCLKYEYRIFGCQECSVYNTSNAGAFSMQSLDIDENTIDWSSWCTNKCQQGDGGAACNCDLLPMALSL